jgi:glycosyltransferase involved in cell wall biosynthesis
LKIAFFLPRYHSNQKDSIQSLIIKNHTVHLYVQRFGKSEDHNIKPRVMKPSLITRIICFFIKKGDIVLKKQRFFIPSLISLFKISRHYDLCVFRDRSLMTATLYIYFKLFRKKTKTILYNQSPYYAVNSKYSFPMNIIRKIMVLLTPRYRYTTVLGNSTNPNITWDDKSFFIPFVISVKPKKEYYFNLNRINILSVGKFTKRKNFIFLIDKLKRYLQTGEVYLTLVGEVTTIEHQEVYGSVIRMVKNLNLENNINIQTNILYNDMSSIYLSNDIFILASKNEPAAYSPLEAMAHSLLPIVSNQNGTNYFIENGKSGYIFDLSDQSLNEIIEYLILNKQKIIEISNCAHKNSLNKYGLEIYEKNLVAIYKKMVKDNE